MRSKRFTALLFAVLLCAVLLPPSASGGRYDRSYAEHDRELDAHKRA
jgi:hypothetical protein